MNQKKPLQLFRLLSLIAILYGILSPWFTLGFEYQPVPVRWSGWEDIWRSASHGIRLAKDGLDLYSIFAMLEFLSGLFLVFYFVYNIFAITRIYKGNKKLSIIIICIIAIFMFESQSGIIGTILVGFWIFVLGLVSFAVIEWTSQ